MRKETAGPLGRFATATDLPSEAREELVHGLDATHHESVGVAQLRHPRPPCGALHTSRGVPLFVKGKKKWERYSTATWA